MFLTHALRAIYRAAVVTGDSLWKYVSLLISGTPPAVTFNSDASVINNVLTITGDTKPSNFNPYTPGYYSNYFDGTGDYLATPAGLTTAMGNGFAGNIITIEGWIYPTSFPSSNSYSNGLIGAYAAVSANGRWWFGVRGSAGTTGNLAFVWTTSTSTENILVSTSNSIVLNAWSHVAITINATTSSSTAINMFINGVLVNTFSGNDLSSQTAYYTSPSIGGNYSIYVNNYVGYISNFRVVKGTAVYTAAFTPPTAPLTAITNTALLTCQSNRLIDTSVNNFAITKNGDTAVRGFAPFTPTASYLGSTYFDGTGDYLTTSNTYAFGTANFTIEAWVYTTAYPASSYAVIFGNINTGTGNAQLMVTQNTTGNLVFMTWNQVIITASTATPLNAWAHVAVTFDGTTYRVFLNGVSVGTSTTLYTFSTAGVGNIGYAGSAGVNNFTGYISDMRIVQGTAVYTTAFTPPTAPLTAVSGTTLLTCQTDQPAANKQFVDNSGSNLIVTQAGNATQGTFSPYGSNWSNYFDGTGDYLTAPTNTAFSLTGNFTIECWLYPTAFTNYKGIWSGTNAINATGFHFGLNAAGNIFIYSNGGFSVTSSNAMTLNAWNHVAVVRNSGVIYIYINGVLSTNSWTTSASFTNAACVIGTNPGPGTEYYFGYISNFRLVNGTAVYTANFTPPTAPLTPIAGTSLLTCQDNRFVDDSPNNFTITRAGDVSVQRFSPFSPVIQTPTTYSTFFDGTGDYLTVPAGAIPQGTENFTIEFWLYKPTAWNSTDMQFIGPSTSTNNALQFYINTTSSLIQLSAFGVVGVLTYSYASLAINTWYHFALTRSGNTFTLYVNGVSVATATSTQSFVAPAGTAIGIAPAVGLAYLGYFSNFRIVRGTAVYTANFTPSTTPLTAIANTSLLTCQSATHIDNSTNALTITQAGDAIPRQFNPFGFTNTTTGTAYTPALYGGSAYFDGTGDYLATPATGQFVATGDFTIQFSFYLTSLAATNHLIGNYTAAVATDWILEVINTGVMQVFLDGSTQRLGHSGITVGQWYHVSITRSGTTVTGRINGAPFNTTPTYTMSGTFGTATKAIFMGMRGGSTNPLFGYLTDVSLVNGTALYKGSFVPPLAPVTATTGTTLLLNMDKGAAVDSSRNNDLETVGDAKVRDETPYAGSYYSNFFDGSSTISIPAGAAFNLSTVDFAIEMWVYPIAQSQYGALLTFDAGDQPIAFYWASAVSTNINFSAGTTSAWIVNAQSFGTTVVNKWTHLLVTRSGNNWRTFQDGVLRGYSNAAGTVADSSGSIYVGANGTTGYASTAYISNLRIIKGSIPTDYQTSSTTAGTTVFTPSSAPLTTTSQGATAANVSLLTCQSKSFVDTSSNAFVVTRNGNTAVKSQNPFQKNTYSSMFFDGTGDYLSTPTSSNFSFGTGDFTIEGWINLSSATGAYRCIVSIPHTGGQLQVRFGDSASYSSYFQVSVVTSAASNVYSTNQNQTALLNQWVHFAFTRSSSTCRVFLNGVLQNIGTGSPATVFSATSFSDSTNITNNAAVGIGDQIGAAIPFIGYIADLRITKSARYTATFTPPTAPLPTS